MGNLIEILIPKAHAQSDAIAQPTFGPITIGDGGSTGVKSTVLLKSDKTSVKDGEAFNVSVEVKTGDIKLTEYTIVVSYDKNYLSVIDQDTSTTGTQVEILDDVFKVSNIANDNNLNTQGYVRVHLTAPDSGKLAVNKDVVKIHFQAKKLGSTALETIRGVSGTRLTRQAGIDADFNDNKVTIEISEEGTVPISNPIVIPIDNPITTPVDQTPIIVPETGLSDTMPFLGLLTGLLLICLGTLLKLNSKWRKRNEE